MHRIGFLLLALIGVGSLYADEIAVKSTLKCRLLLARLERLGLMQWANVKGKDDAVVANVLAARFGVQHFASHHPAIRELEDILGIKANASLSDGLSVKLGGGTKERLRAWRKRHGIAMDFAFPDEIPALAREYVERGVLAPDEVKISDWGNMNSRLWSQLVLDGKLPIVDPHDLVAHVPSLVIPGFQKAIQDKAKFQRALNAYTAKLGDKTGKISDNLSRANAMVLSDARSSYENLAFLNVDESGKPHFVMHGNAGWNLMRSLETDKSQDLLGVTSWLLGNVLVRPRHLPGFKTYVAQNPEFFKKYEDSQKVLGLEEPLEGKVEQKLLGILERLRTRAFAQHESDFSVYLFDHLAEEVYRDPELKNAFNAQNRLAHMEVSLALVDDYLSWSTETNGITPPWTRVISVP